MRLASDVVPGIPEALRNTRQRLLDMLFREVADQLAGSHDVRGMLYQLKKLADVFRTLSIDDLLMVNEPETRVSIHQAVARARVCGEEEGSKSVAEDALRAIPLGGEHFRRGVGRELMI